MKNKTASENLIDFLKNNPSAYASGDLQRMIFKNRNGTTATARSLVRRLQELAEQNIIDVTYPDNKNAYYQIREEHKKKPVMVIDDSIPPIKGSDGRWVPRFIIV